MGVMSPEEMAEAFVKRFNECDVAGLLGLYATDAVFTSDGIALARGADQIRAALDAFVASGMRLKGRYENVLSAGDTAVCNLRWELLDSEGWINQDGLSLEVLRRGEDGLWRFQVDDATGASRPRD